MRMPSSPPAVQQHQAGHQRRKERNDELAVPDRHAGRVHRERQESDEDTFQQRICTAFSHDEISEPPKRHHRGCSPEPPGRGQRRPPEEWPKNHVARRWVHSSFQFFVHQSSGKPAVHLVIAELQIDSTSRRLLPKQARKPEFYSKRRSNNHERDGYLHDPCTMISPPPLKH